MLSAFSHLAQNENEDKLVNKERDNRAVRGMKLCVMKNERKERGRKGRRSLSGVPFTNGLILTERKIHISVL
jgi:hypothetical protein